MEMTSQDTLKVLEYELLSSKGNVFKKTGNLFYLNDKSKVLEEVHKAIATADASKVTKAKK